MIDGLIALLIRRRLLFAGITLALIGILGSQLLHMAFNGNIKVMFDANDAHYQQLQLLEEEYAESNYLVMLYAPADHDVYSQQSLTSLKTLTDRLWQLPYVMRVDALSEQTQLGVDEDTLSITPLVNYANGKPTTASEQIEQYLQQHPQVKARLLADYGDMYLITASIQLTGDHLPAVLSLNEAARTLQAETLAANPGAALYLNGDIVLEDAMLQVTMDDIIRVNPIVFVAIFLLLGLFLRSWVAIAAASAVAGASTALATGLHVMLGFEMNPITMMAPAVVLVIAVADSIHVLTHYVLQRRAGAAVEQALSESLRHNLSPIFWTSVTTAVGFLGMNFGDSPPFRAMGNMAAIGVLCALITTFTILPSVVMLFPGEQPRAPMNLARHMRTLSRWVISMPRQLLFSILLIAVSLCLFIPRMELNDNINEYFDESLPIYESIQVATGQTSGAQFIVYSLDAGEPDGVNQTDFLTQVESFSDWLAAQPEVRGVHSYLDLVKQINQTMHADDPDYYRIPDDDALISQYLLLYEMTLPAGMDLTQDLNIDRSALKLTVNVRDGDNQSMMALEQRIDRWLATNQPELRSQGSSQLLMFAHMGHKIMLSMIAGSAFTLVFITLFMIAALRSLRFGLLSLIPNVFPALVVYGLWAILVGHVNHAAAMTFSICLGLVVDDTIHFMSRYLHFRREGVAANSAIEQTFASAGTAIVITSLTLICGVILLSLSHFTVNDTMSLMLAGIISAALLFDLLFLPSLLLWVDRFSSSTGTSETPNPILKVRKS